MSSPQDYVNNARSSREADARAMLDAEAKGEEYDDGQDPQEAIDEWPLEVRAERHIVIVLSTGGPHEEIDATLYDDGTLKSATFGAYWGSDKSVSQLREGDALWALAQRFAEGF